MATPPDSYPWCSTAVIAALAMVSLAAGTAGDLVVAAADDASERPQDALSEFRLLRTLGELEQAYQALAKALEEPERGDFLRGLQRWVQESSNLDELKDRLVEWQWAWFGLFPDGAGLLRDFFCDLFVPEDDTHYSKYGFRERGLPWFHPDMSLLIDGAARRYRLPGWSKYTLETGRQRIGESVLFGPSRRIGKMGPLWSVDASRALVSTGTWMPDDRVFQEFEFVSLADWLEPDGR